MHYTAVASVLALRGPSVVAQPLRDSSSGSLLLWNGEAWKFRNKAIHGNDTEVILDALVKSCSTSFDKRQDDLHKVNQLAVAIQDVLQAIEGPFAFVFYDGLSECVFYGRDVIGRRSLLVSNSRDDKFNIWREVETGGIFMHTQKSSIQKSQPLYIPWSEKLVSTFRYDLALSGN